MNGHHPATVDISPNRIRMHLKEALFGEVPTLVDSFCTMLAAGNSCFTALPFDLAYPASFSDPRYCSKRSARNFQGRHYDASTDSRRLNNPILHALRNCLYSVFPRRRETIAFDTSISSLIVL